MTASAKGRRTIFLNNNAEWRGKTNEGLIKQKKKDCGRIRAELISNNDGFEPDGFEQERIRRRRIRAVADSNRDGFEQGRIRTERIGTGRDSNRHGTEQVRISMILLISV